MDPMLTDSSIATEDEAYSPSIDLAEGRTWNGSPVNGQADISPDIAQVNLNPPLPHRNERTANDITDAPQILMAQNERMKESEQAAAFETRRNTEEIKKLEVKLEVTKEETKQIQMQSVRELLRTQLVSTLATKEMANQFGKESDFGSILTAVSGSTPIFAVAAINVGIALPVAVGLAGAVGMGVGIRSIVSGSKNRDKMVKQIESLNSAYLDMQPAIIELLRSTPQAARISGQDSNSN